MEDSILKSVKHNLGLADDYDVFDLDVLMAINTAFMTLHQLGVGPPDGFSIEGETETWTQFLSTQSTIPLQAVKTYVYLRTRLIFDPPATSFSIDAFDKQVKELEWRLNVQVDRKPYVEPKPVDV